MRSCDRRRKAYILSFHHILTYLDSLYPTAPNDRPDSLYKPDSRLDCSNMVRADVLQCGS
jgi:hypothetical protein